MIDLTTKELIEIANIFAVDNWEHQSYIDWHGHDLVGDNYIFQLSAQGSIRVWTKQDVLPINFTTDQEDGMRIILNNFISTL